MVRRLGRRRRREVAATATDSRSAQRGFTFIEVVVSLSLLGAAAIFILQAFMAGLAHAGRSNERVAATTLATQIMEQIRASANPYEMVNMAPLPRTPLPLPAPYVGVVNPTPHTFEAAVVVDQNPNFRLITATVEVYRPTDVTPFVTLTTVLDDQ